MPQLRVSSRVQRRTEINEAATSFAVEFESGIIASGSCTIRHTRHFRLEDEDWVPGSHDVDVICDEDLPFGTHGQPGRVTVASGHELVGTNTWKVFPTSRRVLAYGGD